MIRATLALLMCATAAAGCSGSAGGTAPAAPSIPSSNLVAALIPDSSGPLALTIDVTTARESEHRQYTLHCNPVGGTLPGAASACRGYHWLAQHPELPKRCEHLPEETMKHAVARVSGEAGGQPVRFDLTLRTLCSAVHDGNDKIRALGALSGFPRHLLFEIPAASIEYTATNTVTTGP